MTEFVWAILYFPRVGGGGCVGLGGNGDTQKKSAARTHLIEKEQSVSLLRQGVGQKPMILLPGRGLAPIRSGSHMRGSLILLRSRILLDLLTIRMFGLDWGILHQISVGYCRLERGFLEGRLYCRSCHNIVALCAGDVERHIQRFEAPEVDARSCLCSIRAPCAIAITTVVQLVVAWGTVRPHLQMLLIVHCQFTLYIYFSNTP